LDGVINQLIIGGRHPASFFIVNLIFVHPRLLRGPFHPAMLRGLGREAVAALGFSGGAITNCVSWGSMTFTPPWGETGGIFTKKRGVQDQI